MLDIGSDVIFGGLAFVLAGIAAIVGKRRMNTIFVPAVVFTAIVLVCVIASQDELFSDESASPFDMIAMVVAAAVAFFAGIMAAIVVQLTLWLVRRRRRKSAGDVAILTTPPEVNASKTGRVRRFALMVLVVLATAGCYFGYYSMSPLGLYGLPWVSQNVFYKCFDNFPDHDSYFKAEMSKDTFLRYCQRHGLARHTPDRKYEDHMWGPSWLGGPKDKKNMQWWDPSDSLEETYVKNVGHIWTFAKYENGCMYLRSQSH